MAFFPLYFIMDTGYTNEVSVYKLYLLGATFRQELTSLPRQRHALSVTFGDTSPIGRGTGVPVRPTRDEQSLRCPKTVVPCGLDSQQLDKVLLSRSRCPRKRGPPFCALSGLRRPAQSGPARQCLPLWGRWHCEAMTERACRCERAAAGDAPKRLKREG
jgi:hypothetical protein